MKIIKETGHIKRIKNKTVKLLQLHYSKSIYFHSSSRKK